MCIREVAAPLSWSGRQTISDHVHNGQEGGCGLPLSSYFLQDVLADSESHD